MISFAEKMPIAEAKSSNLNHWLEG